MTPYTIISLFPMLSRTPASRDLTTQTHDHFEAQLLLARKSDKKTRNSDFARSSYHVLPMSYAIARQPA